MIYVALRIRKFFASEFAPRLNTTAKTEK